MCRPLFVEYPAATEDFASPAVVVGQDEESVPAVSRPNVGSSQASPRAQEPEGVKVRNDLRSTQGEVSSDVLEEDEGGTALSDDPQYLGPEVTFIALAETRACKGEWLAGVSRCDEIHASTPCCRVEGSQVIPYRSETQRRVRHPTHEAGRSVGFPLDVADSAAPGRQSLVDAADACAEADGT